MRPAFVSAADSYSTLASVRQLGRRGIPVWVASQTTWTRATVSAFCAGRLDDGRGAAGAVERRAALADARAGVLLPSDDSELFLASSLRDLRSSCAHVPAMQTVIALLDKRRLYEEANRARIRTPRTWYPEQPDEAARTVAAARCPVVVKPRTQILRGIPGKGDIATTPNDAASLFEQYCHADYHPSVSRVIDHVERPMLQEVLDVPHAGIYVLSGFAASTGQVVLRGARKPAQWPARVGNGIVFGSADVPEPLAVAARRLLMNVGFVGPFDAEFIEGSGAPSLIDWNPRLYSQLAFDDARGMPVAWLSYLDATGARGDLQKALDFSRVDQSRVVRFENPVLAACRRGAEALRVAAPRTPRRDGARSVSASFAADDWLPALVDAAKWGAYALAHPRSFLGGFTDLGRPA